nr:GNAT family N-acetyltransferase [Mycolicibacterium sarraceniae]
MRPWQVNDAAALVEAFLDPGIQRWHAHRADSLSEARQWIGECVDGWATGSQLNWALTNNASNELLGRASLKAVNLDDGSAELAYWITPAWRGRGLCPSALIALCHTSCRVAVKAGFQEEGNPRPSTRGTTVGRMHRECPKTVHRNHTRHRRV